MNLLPGEPSKIRLLPPLVAERIAAGEVIERPASIIKELLENSLDAGATRVTVHLFDGGKSKIELTDNGSGMSSEDLSVCCLRHATSKIQALEDLEALSTFGFRGEALASVAAVSRLKITSRTKESPHHEAYEIQINNQTLENKPLATSRVSFGTFLQTPHGTHIEVDGLFSQIPARLKFLKSNSAEASAVKEVIEKTSLAHPDVEFQLYHQDKKILELKPSSLAKRVQTLLGEDFTSQIISVEAEHPFLSGSSSLHWICGMSVPHSKKMIQMVNGRVLKDRIIQQALSQAFRQSLLPGQYPALLLQLQIKPSEFDVNVHPTKSEIRFLNPNSVFSAIHQIVNKALEAQRMPLSASKPFAFFQTEPAPTMAPQKTASLFSIRSDSPVPSIDEQMPAPKPDYSTSLPLDRPETMELKIPSDISITPSLLPTLPNFGSAALQLNPASYKGTLFGTYFLFEHAGELIWIDQHAAHERIRFEELQQGLLSGNLNPQNLLMPEIIVLNPEEYEQLEARLHLMQALGFDLEPFGRHSLIVRAVPGAWGNHDLKVRLRILCEKILTLPKEDGAIDPRKLLIDEKTFEKIAMEACRSSVRARDVLHNEQIFSLVDRLFQCKHPWNCPHGRPTLVRTPESKVEEWFLRKIKPPAEFE